MATPLRIIAADGDRDIRNYLWETLPRLGYAVATAEDGLQLVELCRATEPDLVIADVQLPILDGIEATASINRDRPVPVILLSAHYEDDLVSRAGADYIMDLLFKPLTEAQLKTSTALVMVRFQHFLALCKEVQDLRQALEDRKVTERAKGIVMRRLRVDEGEAFCKLRTFASNHNRKLVDVSREVVASEEVFVQFAGA